MIVKDRFPIPTLDELLDELGSASGFTKIDLSLGYHRIRVVSEDTHRQTFGLVMGTMDFW